MARRPLVTLGLSAGALLLFAWPGALEALEWDRAAIASGELWRLLSAHFVHASGEHLLWDVGAFAALGLACERRGRGRFLAAIALALAAVSGTLWIAAPGLELYAGISGLDSALYAGLAAALVRDGLRARRGDRRRRGLAIACGAALGAGLAGKIAFELVTGTTLFLGPGAGVVPVPLAHAAGAVAGALALGLGGRRPRLRRLDFACAGRSDLRYDDTRRAA